MHCKNCGHTVEGHFCSHCGQKTDVRRITAANFFQEVSASVFQVDKGLFYTLRELTVRPGPGLREFLDGKRKRYFKPIAYLLTLSSVYFLITRINNQNTLVEDILTGWMTGATGQGSDVVIPDIALWLVRNYAYSALLLLPVFSFASYLAFLRFGHTYLEHVVINSYITGHQAIIYSLFVIGRTMINHDIIELLPVLGAIAYTFWVYWQLFTTSSRTGNVLRSILTHVLYMIFSTILLGGVMGLAA